MTTPAWTLNSRNLAPIFRRSGRLTTWTNSHCRRLGKIAMNWMPPHRQRFLLAVAATLTILFLALQLFQPNWDAPAVTYEIAVPAQVREILKKSCYDCHSNQTRIGWFERLAPASWIVARDIRRGRSSLNFSEFSNLPLARQQGLLFESVNQIEQGAMPLCGYRWMHPGAVVSADDLATLKDYLISTSPQPVADAAARLATSDQRTAWLRSQNDPPRHIADAPNGIAFPSDYKTWTAISTTERWDNQTMRLVLGNKVAIDAIRRGTPLPWPDGAAFAKLAWTQDSDGMGNVEAGKFLQIELMRKDATKYADTAGWGWARWLGTELKPYGESAQFSAECVRCHTPVKRRDFVFTIPLETGR